MKLSFANLGCCLFLMTAKFAFSEAETDTNYRKWKFNGQIQITNNGISSVPAFSLGKPAGQAFLSLRKGKFSYDPEMACSFNLHPWYINNWFRYRIVDKKLEFRTGVNGTLFFSDQQISDSSTSGVVIKTQRYVTLELAMGYHVTRSFFVSLLYWNAWGFDQPLINGHYISMSAVYTGNTGIPHIKFTTANQVFIINYTGLTDGLFISSQIDISHDKFPISCFIQGVQPLSTNISPYPGLKWNFGVNYVF